MQTLSIEQNPDEALTVGAEVLARGQVLAFPTETVYGLGVRWNDDKADSRLRELKGRNESQPFQVLVADSETPARLGAIVSPIADRLIERFWPGPLTLVLPTEDGGTLGVRMPALPFMLDLIRQAGGAIVATSANRAGDPPAQSAADVEAAFARELEVVLDGGVVEIGVASTVAQLNGETLQLLREGSIRSEDLERIAGISVTRA